MVSGIAGIRMFPTASVLSRHSPCTCVCTCVYAYYRRVDVVISSSEVNRVMRPSLMFEVSGAALVAVVGGRG